ncbi:hypothetical protein [Streptomyces sp. NPDC047042]|uniref:DUF7848 domain-containing protein n=1 Tax=Streptomyces sp. NPDC047042 TaxID=3154807 RepID=UPI0033D717A4
MSRPPVPAPGCATCTDLAGRREAARARFDHSAETDANVLMRQHQGREHLETLRKTRRVFRYVPFTIVQDATAEPEYATRCVSGDESECGAESGARSHPADVEEWQRKHTQDTRHTRYRRTFADYAVMEPPDGIAAGLPTGPDLALASNRRQGLTTPQGTPRDGAHFRMRGHQPQEA